MIPFLCLLIEWREVKRRLPPVRLGSGGGPSRESPTTSSLVAFMSVEELRSFCRVPDSMNLEFSDIPTFSTVGEEDNAVYFTREQLEDGLRFLIDES